MTATDVDPQVLVDQLYERSTKLRHELLERAAKHSALRELPEDKRGDTYVADLRDASQGINHLTDELNSVETLLRQAPPRQPEQPTHESRGPGAAFMELTGIDTRTAGQQFVESEDYQNWRGHGRGDTTSLELGVDRPIRALLDSTTDDSGGNAGLWRPVGQPIPPTPRRMRLFIRDVLASGTTGLAAIPYFREKTPTTTEVGATAVAEGTAKPEVTMLFDDDVAITRKLAAWIPATSEVLDDAPTLRTYIDTRLAYMLDLREEAQIINGPGTGPNIKGILQFTDVQDGTAVSGDMPATIGKDIGLIENVDGFPNFVAYNPLDYWTAVTKRHADQFDASGNVGNAPSGRSNISWGLEEIRTRALASGKALVGDGQMGATVFDRQQTVIRVGNQHSDWFVNNKLVILAEKRLALAVFRPELFVDAVVPTS